MIKHDINSRGKRFFVSCITFLFLTATPFCIFAQQPTPTPPQDGTGNYVAQRNYAFRLYDENNFAAALPLFEKLVIANPSDREVNARLGFILVGSATSYKDPEQRRGVRARTQVSGARRTTRSQRCFDQRDDRAHSCGR